MKPFFIAVFIVFPFIFSCELINDISEIKKAVKTEILDTYTMEPNNPYWSEYEIDMKNTTPKRFDIIEFEYDDETFDRNDFWSSNWHVSRVIGMPNDSLEIINGHIYINDTLLHEPFISDSVRSSETRKKIGIKSNEYYVMIDNRKMIGNDSILDKSHKPYDSRLIGKIQRKKIVGVTNLKKY
ncbi:MAG: signal peptidase I [Fluviicola sp.]